MKIGISLAGISYGSATTNRNRDFRDTCENFFETVYNPLAENHEVTVYTTTYPHALQLELIGTYKPVKSQFLPMEGSHQRLTFLSGLCLVEEEELDILITTRFDISFKQKITDFNIDFEKFNFMFKEKNMWDTHKFVSDTTFILPFKHLYDLYDAVAELHTENLFPQHRFMHHVYQYLAKRIPEEKFNFLVDEQAFSHDNRFYDLKRKEQ